jgi:uncharacterized protein
MSMSSWLLEVWQLPRSEPVFAAAKTLICAAAFVIVPGKLTSALSVDSPSMVTDAAKVELEWGVTVPLRDGVRLSATGFHPRGRLEARPCIFAVTPYLAQGLYERGIYFASHGFSFLAVDARGRGNSEGEFRPFIQEANDGYDIVEWLARQPYCNGKIAMWGGSYSGYAQWATAKELPPHLSTIVPAASPHAGVDFPMRHGIFSPYLVRWLTYVHGHVLQDRVFGDDDFWVAVYRRWFESGRPLRDLDTIAGIPLATFQEWLSYPAEGPHWDAYSPTPKDYEKLRIPILTITGTYDGDQPGALAYYREYMLHASAGGDCRRHYLVIGPWNHGGTRTPRAAFDGIKTGPAALLDLQKLHLDWYEWTMGGGAKPEFLHNCVAYYVTGAERWRYSDSLEHVTEHMEPYFLDSDGDVSDVFHSGSLRVGTAGHGKPDHYIYDPRDTSMSELESTIDSGDLTDQQLIYSAGARRLVYHSLPFEKDTELSGFFKLSAWLSIDQPDTDFEVSIYEVGLDGTSILLSRDQMRARYRVSTKEGVLIQTRGPLRYDFDRFTFVSRKVKRGSRLRLVIGPVNSIYSEKNYNSSGEVSSESVSQARTVWVELMHDAGHASALYVPIGKAE